MSARSFLPVIARKKAAVALSGDWVALQTWNPSGASSVDIDWSAYDSDYDQFEVHFIGMDMSDDGATIQAQGLFSGVAGTDYDEHVMQPDSSANTYAGARAKSATSLTAANPIGNAAGENHSGVLTAYNPTNTSLNKLYQIDACNVDASGNAQMCFNGAELANTGASDGIEISPSSGTFTGKVTLVGRKNIASPSGVTGGPWDYVATYSPSAAATQDVALGSAPMYMIVIENLVPATDAQALRVGVITSDGFRGVNYKYHVALPVSSSTSYAGSGNNSDTSTPLLSVMGSAAGESCACVMYIDNPSSTTTYKNIMWSATGVQDDGDVQQARGATYYSGDTKAVSSLRMFFQSGNIVSGNITVYALSETSSRAWEYVSTTTLAASASQDITLTGAADGDVFAVVASGVQVATDNAALNTFLGSSGVVTSGTYDRHAALLTSASSAYVGFGSSTVAGMVITGNIGNQAAESGMAIANIALPGNSNYPTVNSMGASVKGDGSAVLDLMAGHNPNITGTLDTVRLQPTSGNFTAGGKINLYKLKQGEN